MISKIDSYKGDVELTRETFRGRTRWTCYLDPWYSYGRLDGCVASGEGATLDEAVDLAFAELELKDDTRDH